MAASTFDTLAAADELRDAGFDEKPARAIVGIQQNARTKLATRADLAELRADIYRALWILRDRHRRHHLGLHRARRRAEARLTALRSLPIV